MGKSAVRMETFYPREGWVEQNPYFMISSVKKVISEAIKNAGISVKDIESAGITNQRETTIVWDKNSGIPADSISFTLIPAFFMASEITFFTEEIMK